MAQEIFRNVLASFDAIGSSSLSNSKFKAKTRKLIRNSTFSFENFEIGTAPHEITVRHLNSHTFGIHQFTEVIHTLPVEVIIFSPINWSPTEAVIRARHGALRDEPNNGCVGDHLYTLKRERDIFIKPTSVRKVSYSFRTPIQKKNIASFCKLQKLQPHYITEVVPLEVTLS